MLVVHDPARERAGYTLKVKRGKRETVERFQTERVAGPPGGSRRRRGASVAARGATPEDAHARAAAGTAAQLSAPGRADKSGFLDKEYAN